MLQNVCPPIFSFQFKNNKFTICNRFMDQLWKMYEDINENEIYPEGSQVMIKNQPGGGKIAIVRGRGEDRPSGAWTYEVYIQDLDKHAELTEKHISPYPESSVTTFMKKLKQLRNVGRQLLNLFPNDDLTPFSDEEMQSLKLSSQCFWFGNGLLEEAIERFRHFM